MSFTSYLKNMGIDIGVILLGCFLILVGIAATVESVIIGLVLITLGVISLLYSRYRKTQKGITY